MTQPAAPAANLDAIVTRATDKVMAEFAAAARATGKANPTNAEVRDALRARYTPNPVAESIAASIRARRTAR